VVTACPICQGPVPQPARGRPRAYCSRACQAKGYRARAAAAAVSVPARVEMPGESGTPLREYGEAVLLAAREMARVLDDGAAAPAVAVRLARAARDLAAWADGIAVPAPAPAPAAAPAPPRIPARDEIRESKKPEPRPARGTAPIPSRDETGAEKEPQPQRRSRRTVKESTRAESPAAVPTWETTAIKPVPQKLPKKKAAAVLDAAELVRHPDYQDNHRWILRSGDVLIGYVVPSYGGASRSGRNGWVGSLGGAPGPRCHSRDGAKMDLAAQWLRLVTATPKR
jgi:hypothetical protein